jgi:tRNA nucleotidyltransferase (CCA-adding enzyme)
MLRAIRFEVKLGFSIEDKTSQAIRRIIPRLLGTVARERIADELYRALILNPNPAKPELTIDD